MTKLPTVYGKHPVAQLLKTQPDSVKRVHVLRGSQGLAEVVDVAEAMGIPVVHGSKRDLGLLAGGGVHQGVVAVVAPFSYRDLDDLIDEELSPAAPKLILVLDEIQDPHNLGALARSALAFGARGLVIPKDRACEVTPVAVKSSAGALTHLPVARVTNLRRALSDLKEAGYWVVGTVADGGQDLKTIDFQQPIALVIGSEGKGMRQKVEEMCDFLAHIPLDERQASLNASVAGSICMYESLRQRS